MINSPSEFITYILICTASWHQPKLAAILLIHSLFIPITNWLYRRVIAPATPPQAFGLLLGIMGQDAIDLGTPNPRGTQLANLSIIFGTISTVLVIARIVTRITIFKRTGADDYCIIVASVSDINPSRPASTLLILLSAHGYCDGKFESHAIGQKADGIAIGTVLTAGHFKTVVYCEEARNGFGLHDSQVSWAHKVTALKASTHQRYISITLLLAPVY